MALKPDIVHVVGHTEADHAATAEDVIAACQMAQRSIENAIIGQPDFPLDPRVQDRREELVSEAMITLQAIRTLAGKQVEDAFTDPTVLTLAVTEGILDAPQLRNNPFARGAVATQIDERGACIIVDPASGKALSEARRLSTIWRR